VPVERLTHLITDAHTNDVDALLRSLDGSDRAEARRWFEGSRSWFRRLRDDLFGDPWANRLTTRVYTDQYPDLGTDARDASVRDKYDINDARSRIEGMCAVALSGPVTAARRVPWREYWNHQEDPGESALVHLLWDADRDWVASFADAASGVGLGGNARNVNGTLSRILRAAVVHHELPCPSGSTFLAQWLSGSDWKGSTLDTLREDPLMPDLLFHYLASGHCGQVPWASSLPEVVAELVETGRVDRAVVLEHVLSLLTAPQRPASQRVLAKITTALNLRAEEIPGGLTFLLGVLSTSHTAVGGVLLPHAIELVADSEGLVELTTVVVARSERKQKEVLLAGLRAPALQSVVGIGHVHEALRLLGASEDAAFADKVARVVVAIGGSVEPDDAPAAVGLWNLAPSPAGGEHRRSWWPHYRLPNWSEVLDSRYRALEFEQPWLVELALTDMVQGTFFGGEIVRQATRLLEVGRLNLARLARALEDLFLGGGMRESWEAAMAIADACCAAPRKPAGLAELLRTLAAYAHEAPAQDLPRHILALAAAEGQTKAQMEARKLGATLSGTIPDEYVRRVRSAKPPVAERPVVRGLWHADFPTDPLLSEQRLEDLTLDLPSLRLAFEANFNFYHQNIEFCFWGPGYSETDVPGTQLTFPDRLLAATVRAIHRHGAEAVRGALTGVERKYQHHSLDVVAAIDLWLADRLDVATFWRLALRSVTQHEVQQGWLDDPAMTRSEAFDRVRALPGLVQALDLDPLVLPMALDGAPARLAFLRACESLLRAGDAPVVLSEPTYADCTLDFDDLLARLKAAYGAPVGPLDLVQALHRLRPTDPARLVELNRLPMPTAAELTDPQGADVWDAVDLVSTWVGSGGLPQLQPVDDAGRWSTTAKAPVPWSRCAAAPGPLREDDWFPGPIMETVRLMPQWGDRTMSDAYQVQTYFDPRHFPGRIAGPFGLPLHDKLLAFLAHQGRALDTVLDVARHDRLDPEMAAAAAVGRHGAGSLAAGRLTQSLNTVFENGGFRGMWPSALAIAAALCEVPNKPSGLPDLLRLLTAYAHEVPEPRVPDALRRFAEARGSSRSHVESRGLVAALEPS
jgi:hypothetical protein